MAYSRLWKMIHFLGTDFSTCSRFASGIKAINKPYHFIYGPTNCLWSKKCLCTSSSSESTSYGMFDLGNYSTLITSPAVEKEIKMILLQYELAKQSHLRVPSEITEKAMRQLLKETSVRSREKYFHYLGTIELKILSQQMKKEERKKELQKIREENANQQNEEHITYGLGRSSMLPYVYKSSIDKLYLSRLIHAATMEPPLILDMCFEDEMTERQIRNLAKQIQHSYGANRKSREPFDLCLCNVHSNSKTLEELKTFIPNLYCPTSMLTIEESDYVNLYPKEKLIYLTPDAREVLDEFQSDKIYIIGGLVDTGAKKPLTLAKAKRQGIQTAKLPLDKYLLWGLGRKSLTIDQIVCILLDWKRTNDWKKALVHVPRRFLKSQEDVENEERSKKFRSQHSQHAKVKLQVSNWFNHAR